MALAAALRSWVPLRGTTLVRARSVSFANVPKRSLVRSPRAVPASTSQAGMVTSAVQAEPAFKDSLVVLATENASKPKWAEALRATGLEVYVYPDDGPADLSRAEFAVVWGTFPELWKQCPNLKAVQVMGAGVDKQLLDPEMPRSIPLLRVIDPLMSERMATFVMWGVINIQRKCDAYYRAQQQRHWAKDIENFRSIDNSELRVGIMGLGVMGSASADLLSEAGYQVSAWTRTQHDHEGVTCYHGPDQLHEFVSNADVLVCLLPLTPTTRGIINAELLCSLPRGAAIINGGRGGHVVERDLLAALDSGQLSSAILDVFDEEPLPDDSPLWTHPGIRIFPHVAAMTNIDSSISQMLNNRSMVLSGRPTPKDLTVDLKLGY